MADLTIAKDVASKVGDELTLPMGVVKIFGGGAVAIVKGTGYAVKVDAATVPPRRFVGVALGTVDNSAGSAGDKSITVARKGIFKFVSSGLTVADIGKSVYFSDDNTVSTTINLVYAGKLRQVDAEGAWVEIDDAVVRGLNLRTIVSPALIPIAGTVREAMYVVPAGAKAYLQALSYMQMTKPVFATTAALDVKTWTAATGTSSLTGTKSVNNNADALDTFLATGITLNASGHASRQMAAGDHLAPEVVTTGGLTTAGKLYVKAEILEWGGDND